MKKVITILVIGVFSVGMALPYANVATPQVAEAAVSNWQRGGSIYPTWTGDFDTDSFRQSLRNLKATGANSVALIVPEYQANTSSSDIYAGGDTPTDASLISAINYAHSIGLSVMLKPHLGPQTGEWRAQINASDRDAWFRNYGNMLSHLADIANQTGAEGICMGTELVSMSTYTSNGDNTERWQAMISMLRSKYHGFLTYSGNWGTEGFAEEVAHIGFWPQLDFMGISAYYPLAQGQTNPSVDALTSSWDYWNNTKIQALHNQFNKPILFTEIGYRSADGAHNAPFDPFSGGGYNPTEQVNDYQALMQYWNNQSYMVGAYLWNWNSDPNNGGQGNTDYTPQGKPAQDTLTSLWSGGGNPTPPGNPPPPNPPSGSWSATGSNPGNLAANTSATFPVTVKNSGSASDVIVDVEIQDASNNKLYQQFFEHQNISSSQPGRYQVSWTPPSQGNYKLEVGVFNNNWSTNYYWNSDALDFTVGNQGNPTPPPTNPPPTNPPPTNPPTGSVDTNIWWPTDGSTVSGVQPFKAMLTNMSVSDYTMYWQVDGGTLNQMSDNSTDYPHKEADVDLSGWNWKGSGPYTINFVSKDKNGNVISQKSANINISH